MLDTPLQQDMLIVIQMLIKMLQFVEILPTILGTFDDPQKIPVGFPPRDDVSR